MSALVVLITASLIIASGFLFAFIRATRKGQYEDVYTPSIRMLFDDVPAKENNESKTDKSFSEIPKEQPQNNTSWK